MADTTVTAKKYLDFEGLKYFKQSQDKYNAKTFLGIDANAKSASKLAAAVKIGGVDFDGSTAIDLPGVNTKGNQDTTGNAATATKLAAPVNVTVNLATETAAAFDGSAAIEPGVEGILPVAHGGTGAASLADITVGTATKALQDGNGDVISETYAKKSDMATAYVYRGSVDNYSDLPTAGQNEGDVYNIANADKNNNINAGDNVAWNGSSWDNLSGIVDLSNYVTKDGTKVLSTNDFTNELKTKLEGIEDNANKYVLPIATQSTAANAAIGGVMIGDNISLNAAGTISLTKDNVVGALGYTPVDNATIATVSNADIDGLFTTTGA